MSADEKKNVSFSFVYNRRNTTDGLNFFLLSWALPIHITAVTVFRDIVVYTWRCLIFRKTLEMRSTTGG